MCSLDCGAGADFTARLSIGKGCERSFLRHGLIRPAGAIAVPGTGPAVGFRRSGFRNDLSPLVGHGGLPANRPSGSSAS